MATKKAGDFGNSVSSGIDQQAGDRTGGTSATLPLPGLWKVALRVSLRPHSGKYARLSNRRSSPFSSSKMTLELTSRHPSAGAAIVRLDGKRDLANLRRMDRDRRIRCSPVVDIHAHKDARPTEAEFRGRCSGGNQRKIEGTEAPSGTLNPPRAGAPVDHTQRILALQYRTARRWGSSKETYCGGTFPPLP